MKYLVNFWCHVLLPYYDFSPQILCSGLKNCGNTTSDLKIEGYTTSGLKNWGNTTSDPKIEGYTTSGLTNWGNTTSDPKIEG